MLAAVYSKNFSAALVNGCYELVTNDNVALAGKGFMVGSRNDERGRYLVGTPLLLYPTMISLTNHLKDAYSHHHFFQAMLQNYWCTAVLSTRRTLRQQ